MATVLSGSDFGHKPRLSGVRPLVENFRVESPMHGYLRAPDLARFLRGAGDLGREVAVEATLRLTVLRVKAPDAARGRRVVRREDEVDTTLRVDVVDAAFRAGFRANRVGLLDLGICDSDFIWRGKKRNARSGWPIRCLEIRQPYPIAIIIGLVMDWMTYRG